MKFKNLLIGSLLLISVTGCQQSDTGWALPQTLQAEPPQADVRKLEVYSALAEQYLHSGKYHIEYSDLPVTILSTPASLQIFMGRLGVISLK